MNDNAHTFYAVLFSTDEHLGRIIEFLPYTSTKRGSWGTLRPNIRVSSQRFEVFLLLSRPKAPKMAFLLPFVAEHFLVGLPEQKPFVWACCIVEISEKCKALLFLSPYVKFLKIYCVVILFIYIFVKI